MSRAVSESKVELNDLLQTALEDFGGGFSLMRAVRDPEGGIADWELLHANAYHMAVVAEPLRTAVDRIARAGLPIAAIRRIEGNGA